MIKLKKNNLRETFDAKQKVKKLRSLHRTVQDLFLAVMAFNDLLYSETRQHTKGFLKQMILTR